jgi:hypothetical protein
MKLLTCFILLTFLLSACQPSPVQTEPLPVPTETVSCLRRVSRITRAPDARSAAGSLPRGMEK